MRLQSTCTNYLFIFLLLTGVSLLYHVFSSHFQFLRILLLGNYLLFLGLSFLIHKLKSANLRRILIGSYLFVIGTLFSLLYGNPFNLSAWTLYFIGAFFGALLWDYFCQKFNFQNFIRYYTKGGI